MKLATSCKRCGVVFSSRHPKVARRALCKSCYNDEKDVRVNLPRFNRTVQAMTPKQMALRQVMLARYEAAVRKGEPIPYVKFYQEKKDETGDVSQESNGVDGSGGGGL